MQVSITVNGEAHTDDVAPRSLLVHYLRDVCGLTATNVGCDTTSCGACTVHVDGESVKSCTVLTVQADDCAVTTLEGLAATAGDAALDGLHPMQAAFRAEHGLQCGFCTPGMVMAATALLQDNPNPSESEIREGLEGNLCRCTGYHNMRAGRAACGGVIGGVLERRERVIPAAFDYVRARSVEHAIALLVEHGDEAKLLAGGHSLLPMMKLRLAFPTVLVDVGRLRDEAYVRVEGNDVAIGALTRHSQLVRDPVLAAEAPLVGQVASFVGDPQIRHRGTIGGSIVHADPAADLPAAVLASDATLVVDGPQGRRTVPARQFFRGYFETALEADEMLVEIRVPRTGPTGSHYEKFTRRANDWAIVGVATVAGRVALANMGGTPLRAEATEAALAAGATIEDAAAVAHEGTSPIADMHGDGAYRQHLARVLTCRALASAAR